MSLTVRRGAAIGLLSTLSLAVALLGPLKAGPIGLAVVLAALAVTDGPVFRSLATPEDRKYGRLYGLLGFIVAAIILGLIVAISTMPISLFVGTIWLVGFGLLSASLGAQLTDDEVLITAVFCLGGGLAAIAGQVASRAITDSPIESALALIVFVAASGVLLAAYVRELRSSYEDPVVILSVGLLSWLLVELEPGVGTTDVLVAIAITAAVGYVSYALGAASVAGMLSGTLLVVLTLILGGYNWFAVLISFFALGSLSTKFRYDVKTDRGIAEANNGARGGANVFGNAAVALLAVLAYAASSVELLPVDPLLFLFAFAGSVSTAMSDTLSSEIGGVFDNPRLITTFESVDPGTDGGVTWQGEVAGVAGALIVAALSALFFTEVGGFGAVAIVVAGFLGMTVDSLLGATIEGSLVGNQGVNLLATFSGALVAALIAFSVGLY